MSRIGRTDLRHDLATRCLHFNEGKSLSRTSATSANPLRERSRHRIRSECDESCRSQLLPTPTAVAGVEGYGFNRRLSVCLSVCLLIRTISQKTAAASLGPPNLTRKCSTTSPENSFIWRAKVTRHKK